MYRPITATTGVIKYYDQSNFINELEVPVDNNNRGLKGIIINLEDNVWFYHIRIMHRLKYTS